MSTDAITPRRILLGDALLRLRELPTKSVDCVVTSPPYFRLRDYGMVGQVGLEEHVRQWSQNLRRVVNECGRVLTPTGTLWLNVGDTYSTHPSQGAPRKSLVGAPERLLVSLLEDGWICRNKIVWAKANHTPTSVTDRLAGSYEVIYLLTRSPKYHFALDDIRVPHLTKPTVKRRHLSRPGVPPSRTRPAWLGPNSDHDSGLAQLRARGAVGHPLGKNPGDVWRFSTSNYRGAHFATYPEHLVEQMLRAGCPERVCLQCRAPWSRPLLRRSGRATRLPLTPSCAHDNPGAPGLVLDPFIGSGTTAVVAERLGRDWLGIELNPEFQTLAWQRIRSARPDTNASRGGPS